MADADTMRRLWRCKSDLEQEPDEEKLIEILGKLKKLAVTISALQETGIGKLVNSYRKHEGAVGELARHIVSSWKLAVEKEVKSSKNRSPSESRNNSDNEETYNENESGVESDADSWNSYKEENDRSQRLSNGGDKMDSESGRKRKNHSESYESKERVKSSRTKKEEKRKKHSEVKKEHLKSTSADEYSPSRKKYKADDDDDVDKNRSHSKVDGASKVSSHTVTVKIEGEKRSSGSHSREKHHSEHSGHTGSREREKAIGDDHKVDEKGDRQNIHTKIDRKKKHHVVSSSGEEDDEVSDDTESNNRNSKSSLSSSHKHCSSTSSHKHTSFSSSHKDTSSSSHKDTSSNSHKHSSSSNSHKHSSSSSHSRHSSSKSSLGSSGELQHQRASASSSVHQSTHESSHQNHSSASKAHPGSSAYQELSGHSHKHSSHRSSPHEKSSGKSSSEKKDSSHHDSDHHHDKKSAAVDHKSRSSSSSATETNSSALKSKSGSADEKHLSSDSHRHRQSTGQHASSDGNPEKEQLYSKSSSSVHKEGKSSPVPSKDRPEDRISPSPVHTNNPHSKGHHLSNEIKDVKISLVKNSVAKSSTSSHRKSKPKKIFEEPEFDLFTDAIQIKKEPSSPIHKSQIKKEPSSPVHKSKSVKLESSKSKKPSPSPSPTPDKSPSDSKAKSSSSSKGSDKYSAKSKSIKDDIKKEKDEDSDSLQEPKKSKHERVKDKETKTKNDESPMKDENEMSFEDFMTFDEAAMVKKGRSSQKSSTAKSSSSSSSKSSQKTADKPQVSKWSSSLAVSVPSSSKTDFSVPAPTKEVMLTETDILSMLPETQAHYKPLRYNPYLMDEEKEPSPQPKIDPDLIGIKTLSRTHVYSGRKHGVTEIKSLYDLCMQVLIDNIDAIDCVGGIPYNILKPVLERCTAQQLYQLEDYNPHFLEDTDELWDILCQREFRGRKPGKLESWRELYMRLFEERELKYQKLKQTVSSSIVKGQAGRKAQLAFVDTVAKPPREVLRKQKQFGTGCIVRTKGNPNIKGSSSGLKAYKPSTAVPAHNPINDKPRILKPLPPMMAKSLQMRKNLRR